MACVVIICGCPQKTNLVHIQTRYDAPTDSVSVTFFSLFGSSVQPWSGQTVIRHNMGERELSLVVRVINNKSRNRFWCEIQRNGIYYSGFIVETQLDSVFIKKCYEAPKLLRKNSVETFFDIGLIGKDSVSLDIRSLAQNYINDGVVDAFVDDSISRSKGLKLIISGIDNRSNSIVLDTIAGDGVANYYFDGLNTFLLHPCGWYYPLTVVNSRGYDPLE